MIIIEIPHEDPEYDAHHGTAQWTERLTYAPHVWLAYGVDLNKFNGQPASACIEVVKSLIGAILTDPWPAICATDGPTAREVTSDLTRLFFTLDGRRSGTVLVST